MIASLVAEGDEIAAALARDLAERQEVETVTAAGLADALTIDRPGYMVVFGMDAMAGGALPPDRLRLVLRTGPGRGVHLLSWWRGLRRFTDEVGPRRPRRRRRPGLPQRARRRRVACCSTGAVDWQPRDNRALLHDRHTDRTSVIVPFVRPEADR